MNMSLSDVSPIWTERDYNDLDEQFNIIELENISNCSDAGFGDVFVYKTEDLDADLIQQLDQRNTIWSIEVLDETDTEDDSLDQDILDDDIDLPVEDDDYDEDDVLVDLSEYDEVDYVITAGFMLHSDFVIVTEKSFDDEIKNTIWGWMRV